ncbi:head decoration protein D [Aurantimonas phage AmM-1]|uniref:head decoration protein D n=1 Tax=Aurantimonas phage AmM-1 TaxID=1503929 RepID=UPI000540A4B3|nr:head decoration protein D [Aurantimonas phage AmM-1]BAP94463.1 head decoration protein D [Aurantimonas phage AmM-1]
MVEILTEGRRGAAHYIVSEAHGYRSREQGVVASGAGVLSAGQVMGQVTATGKYVPVDPDAVDGSEKAAAILYEGCDATDADVRRTFTVRDTEVHADVLAWVDGTTDPEKTAALAELAAAGIVGR